MNTTIIDTNVQPHFRYNAEIRRYLPDAHNCGRSPTSSSSGIRRPGGDYRQDLYGEHYPGSDPDTVEPAPVRRCRACDVRRS